jgi:alkaline phosphatase
MKFPTFNIVFVCLALLLGAGCSQLGRVPESRPKNIILLVGDGMGLAQVSSIFYEELPVIHFARFPTTGLIQTWSAREKVTDSAAGATAFASGVKSYNGAIGVDADTSRVGTILENAARRGRATGLIATSSIQHATPASFYAHVPSRQQYEDISVALVDAPVDFFAGGGLQFFTRRSDGVDLYSRLEASGFVMESTALIDPGMLSPDQRYGFLLAADGMPPMLEGRGPFLEDATRLALQRLSADEDGFFLMIEGSQIDWGGHGNNAAYLVSEMKDFNDVLGIVLDYAEEDGETLVVVTADHETGGFALSAGETYDQIAPTFSTGGHTATLIPVFAFGPGSGVFDGIYDNTEIYHKMMSAWGR